MGKGQRKDFHFTREGGRLTLWQGEMEIGFINYHMDSEDNREFAKRVLDESVKEEAWYLDYLYIHRMFRGKGYAHLLAAEIVDVAVGAGVGVLIMHVANPRTASVFRHYGRLYSRWGEVSSDEDIESYWEYDDHGNHKGSGFHGVLVIR